VTDVRRISPPFDSEALNDFARAAFCRHGRDIRDTVRWLLDHNSSEALVAAVRSAWVQTDLPLHDWAEVINDVGIEIHEEYLELAVDLTGWPGTTVRQAAPFTRDRLAQLARSFPMPFPGPMATLALAAPGLCLGSLGALAEPRFFLNRLGYMRSWLREKSAEEAHRYGFQYLDPNKQLIEVASDGIGDCYAVNRDCSLVFLDHEARGLVPCNITLEQLFGAYFASAESIVDPYARGWAVFPRPPKPIARHETPQLTLQKRLDELPGFASLALAIRGCQRAMVSQHLGRIPEKWKHHHHTLEQILDRCKQVVVRNVPLVPSVADEFCAACTRSTRAWKAVQETLEDDYSAILLTSRAIPALAQACAHVDNTEKIDQAVASCSAIIVYRADVRDNSSHRADLENRSSLAALRDIDNLLTFDLGAPRALGKPVPASFFDCPAWPKDLQRPKC
jgi:hypothetical protein